LRSGVREEKSGANVLVEDMALFIRINRQTEPLRVRRLVLASQ
jgi:hypothetical protein